MPGLQEIRQANRLAFCTATRAGQIKALRRRARHADKIGQHTLAKYLRDEAARP